VNCFRPLDPIGTKLGLNKFGWTTEISTGQWWRVLDAHNEYWQDEAVLSAWNQSLTRLEYSELSAIDLTNNYPLTSISKYSKRQLKAYSDRVLKGALLLGPLLTAIVALALWLNQQQSRIAELKSLNARGITTEATLTYYSTQEESLVGTEPTQTMQTTWYHFTFAYKDRAGVPHSVYEKVSEGMLFAEAKNRPIDFVRLADTLNKLGTPIPQGQGGGKWLKLPIRYSLDDPLEFVVPGYPPKIKGHGLIFGEWMFVLVGGVPGLMLMTWVTYLLGQGTMHLLIGEVALGQTHS
jgi:hypothetical protein